MIFFCGKVIFASVDFPLWCGPVIPMTANCEASLNRASFAFLSIIVVSFFALKFVAKIGKIQSLE